jgi:3-deoxy-D-manno-octulosonic-acid transferase
LPDTLQVLVLDTIGELKDFYAASTIAHVGRNHNLLEPLAYGKPVTTSGLWEPQHPSYPIYRLLVEASAIIEQDTPDRLAAEWLRVLSEGIAHPDLRQSACKVMEQLAGASARNLELLKRELGSTLGRFPS